MPNKSNRKGTLYFVLGPWRSSNARKALEMAQVLGPEAVKEFNEIERRHLTIVIERNGTESSILEQIIDFIIPEAGYRLENIQIGISTSQGMLLPNIAVPIEDIVSPMGISVDILLHKENLQTIAAFLGENLQREWVRTDVFLK